MQMKWNIEQKKQIYSVLQATRQTYFKQGERAGKLLAHTVKDIQHQNIIPLIFHKDNNVNNIMNRSGTNTTFGSFMKNCIHAKDKVGLSLSQIDWYYLSSSSSQLSKIHLPPTRVPLWVKIEEKLVYPFSVEAFLSQTDGPVSSQDPVLAFAS